MGDNDSKPLGRNETNENSGGSDGAAEAFDEESPLPGVDDGVPPEQVRQQWNEARQQFEEAEESSTDDPVDEQEEAQFGEPSANFFDDVDEGDLRRAARESGLSDEGSGGIVRPVTESGGDPLEGVFVNPHEDDWEHQGSNEVPMPEDHALLDSRWNEARRGPERSSWIRRFVAVILGKGWVFPVSLVIAVAVGVVAAWLVFFSDGGDTADEPLSAASTQTQPVESGSSQVDASATDEVDHQNSNADTADASGSPASPAAKVEGASLEPTAQFLAQGGTLDGLLTLDSVQKEQTYDTGFTLTTQLPLSAGQDEAESYRETVRSAVEKIDVVKEILEGQPQVLSQYAPDGSQNTFGLGVTLQDDSTRFVTIGGDGYLELFVLEPFPCDGFPTECDEVAFGGWTLGWEPNVDTDQLIEAALNGFSPDDTYVTDAFWAETINGSLTAVGPELIVNLETGTFPDGKMGVKVDLGRPDPFGDAAYVKTVGVTVRDDTGGFYSGSFGSVGGVLGANGFCGLGDNCPSDGTWSGFTAVLDDAGVIVFSFDPLEGNLTVAAEVSVDDAPDPDSPTYTSSYLNGQQVPFGTGALSY
jgi:hypothetical protein